MTPEKPRRIQDKAKSERNGNRDGSVLCKDPNTSWQVTRTV